MDLDPGDGNFQKGNKAKLIGVVAVVAALAGGVAFALNSSPAELEMTVADAATAANFSKGSAQAGTSPSKRSGRLRRCTSMISTRDSSSGRSTKKISSSRPRRSNSGGNA